MSDTLAKALRLARLRDYAPTRDVVSVLGGPRDLTRDEAHVLVALHRGGGSGFDAVGFDAVGDDERARAALARLAARGLIGRDATGRNVLTQPEGCNVAARLAAL